MKLPPSLLGLLELGLNRALQLDPEALERMIALSGKSIAIEIRGLELVFYLLPALDGVQLAGEIEGQPDAVIRGGPFSLLHTALTGDRSRLFEGAVEIEGDMELGQRVQRLLNRLQPDWEEPLARLLGEVPAHQLGQMGRELFAWLGRAADTLARDGAEYLQEERRELPSPYELEHFMRGVDDFRDAVERLQQRLRRLQERLP